MSEDAASRGGSGERRPARRQTTIDDVAREAGVSSATVSNAILGRGRMSEKTRARVLQVARELDYSVNQSARALRTSRAGSIGLYIPQNKLSLAYYMDFCFGVVDTAADRRVAVTLVPSGVRDVALRAQVDGFVLIDPPAGDTVAEAILSGPLPVVSGDGVPAGLEPPSGVVQADHRATIGGILEHLAERGARRPALISGGRATRWSQEVEDGYRDWAVAHGVEPRIVSATQSVDAAAVARLTADLLDAADAPDAVISAPVGTAVGVVTAAQQRGIRVGSQLLVTGYTDSAALSLCAPPVTAVDSRPREFGAQCARLLVRQIEAGGRRPETVVEAFETPLLLRASSAGSSRRSPRGRVSGA